MSGPDRDVLTKAEVAAYLALSEDTIDRLVERGLFPTAIYLTPKNKVWGWMDVVAYLHLLGRGVGAVEAPETAKEATKKGSAGEKS